MNPVQKMLDRTKSGKSMYVVVAGDRLLDRWWHGRLEPCQDGCQKFVMESVVETPGGAANAWRSITNWGTNTLLYSQSVNIPIKTRYVDQDNKITFRSESSVERSDDVSSHDACLSQIERSASAVLLSDYDKGYLTQDFIRSAVATCRRRNIYCVVDCKRPPSTYDNAHVLKGNANYWSRYPAPLAVDIVMTEGELYPSHFGQDLIDFKLPPVKCVNHVGAGDCFAAHLTLALACGLPLGEAVAVAHSAGRVYVQHPHNRPPTPQEVEADLLSAR